MGCESWRCQGTEYPIIAVNGSLTPFDLLLIDLSIMADAKRHHLEPVA